MLVSKEKGLPIIGRLYRSCWRGDPTTKSIGYHYKETDRPHRVLPAARKMMVLTTGSWIIFTRHRVRPQRPERYFYADVLYDGKVYEYVEFYRRSWRKEFASSHGKRKNER